MFQLISYDVATSWLSTHTCRDIHSSPLQSSMVAPDVATSISCHDLYLMNCRFQLISSNVATSLSYRDITLCFCRLHWLFMMSRPQSFCRDIIPLVSAQSSAAYTVILVATCIKFPSLFLMSQPRNWTVQTLYCINDSASCFHFCSAIWLHFYSTYCCIFLLLFLLSSILPANKKWVSFFIFLQSNCPLLYENQAEKWTKNR